MIQDIAPKKLINHYEPRTVSADSLIMVFDSEGKILYRYNEQKQQIEFPRWKDIPGGAKIPDEDVQYLFSIGYEDGNELQAGSVTIRRKISGGSRKLSVCVMPGCRLKCS